jgi:hypothetical protein
LFVVTTSLRVSGIKGSKLVTVSQQQPVVSIHFILLECCNISITFGSVPLIYHFALLDADEFEVNTHKEVGKGKVVPVFFN